MSRNEYIQKSNGNWKWIHQKIMLDTRTHIRNGNFHMLCFLCYAHARASTSSLSTSSICLCVYISVSICLSIENIYQILFHVLGSLLCSVEISFGMMMLTNKRNYEIRSSITSFHSFPIIYHCRFNFREEPPWVQVKNQFWSNFDGLSILKTRYCILFFFPFLFFTQNSFYFIVSHIE